MPFPSCQRGLTVYGTFPGHFYPSLQADELSMDKSPIQVVPSHEKEKKGETPSSPRPPTRPPSSRATMAPAGSSRGGQLLAVLVVAECGAQVRVGRRRFKLGSPSSWGPRRRYELSG